MAYQLAMNVASKTGKVVYVVDHTHVTTTLPASGNWVEVHP